MKKILTTIIISAILSTSASAVNMEVDTSQTQQDAFDKSISSKKSKDIKESQSNRESESFTKDVSDSTSKEVAKIAQVDILNFISELEMNKVYPFNKCQILNNPKLSSDFGITSEIDDGVIDTNFATLLDKAVQNNQYVSSVIGINEKALYDYVSCINYYSAVIAQALKTGELKGEIQDIEIKKTYERAKNALTKAMTDRKFKVKFHKSIDTFTINALKIRLDYEPSLSFNQVSLYGENFHGYTANSRQSISLVTAVKEDKTTAKDNSINLSKTKDVTFLDKSADTNDYSFKTSFSMREYLPK